MRSRTVPGAALIVVLSAVVGGVFGGSVMGAQDRTFERQRMFTAALAAIEREYAEPVDSAQLVYGSIDGMLRTLDPHSSFQDPKAYAQMRERQEGHYFGIGISIQLIGGDVTVTSLFEGSPAYRAGIRRGDIIARVGKEVADGWTTEDVVRRVKGPKGTSVNIGMRRPGVEKEIDLTVERDEINIVTVRTSFMIAPGTGYVRLQDFMETSDAEMSAALGKLKTAGMQRLILDLRDNPGGLLDQAIAIANRFLKRGQMIVYTKGRLARSDEKYIAEETGDYTTIPLIVLTSRGSASASEIVTGAMQDHDRAIVVGETTFGKALVQSVFNVSNGAGLLLTSGRYYTPSGRMIQRPWDGAFDEYLTYSLRDQNANRPHPASELKHTDSGRVVYGGGGIEPDHFIPGPVEGFNPSRFSRIVLGRGEFIGFARRFTREGDNRPAARSAAHTVARGWTLTDAIVEEFKQFLIKDGVKIDEEAFKTDLPFIKAMLRYEVDGDLFGNEEARKNLSKVDPQVQASLGYFDEAKRLLDASGKTH